MNNRELMQRRPWFAGQVRLPHDPAGMLGNQEASLCYYLAKDAFGGRGTIVDAGSFLGKSAYFFAQGLRANPSLPARSQRIHCFDNFLVNEAMTVRFIANELGRTVAIGTSTRALFDAQVEPVRDAIEIHAGDFHTIEWSHQPIEILMVDIAKSVTLGQSVVELFFGDLIPGASLVIQQDYHHPWLPHIHVVMEYLAEYFELVVPRVDDSAVFQYQTAIPAEVLRRAVDYDFTNEEQLRLMDAAVRRLSADDRYYVQLAGVVLKSRLGQRAGLMQELEELQRRFNERPLHYSQNSYFEDVASYLNEVEAWRLQGEGDFAGSLRLADDIVARRRNSYSLVLRGYALSGLQRYGEAEREFRAALEVGPCSGYCYVELARVLMLVGRLADAEAEVLRGLRDAAAIDASTKDYLEVLYSIWTKRATPPKERATMEALFRERPNDPEVWVLDGRLHHMSGDDESAARSWRRAIEIGLPPERLDEVR
jgi:tetratricopeptide (TPR) repeat protein